jgi:hypothetical protein
MGLDQYLYIEKDVSDIQNKDELAKLLFSMYGISGDISSIKTEVGYFRKFNALHELVIKQCGYDVTDDSNIRLDKEACEKILNALEEVEKDHNKAEELVPTTDCFFFGSLDYDEYYYECVENAVKLFKKIIKQLGDYDTVWYMASY